MTAANTNDPIRLINTIDDRRKRAETLALDMSLNELADMYENDELNIRPEYQRLFRWPPEKQSRFIESLILEMPIPPIFAIELEEGKWELIDGLQRLSTYLHFRGKLAAEEQEIQPGTFLELEDCDILTELNGKKYDDLPSALQIRLKRAFLNVRLVRKDTDARFRYYMFKRLNTGGAPLSEQEIRNCTIRLLGSRFNDFLADLARNVDFIATIEPLTEEKRRQMGDIELVLRFFAFKNNFTNFRHDIGEFLTTYMEGVTDGSLPFDYLSESAAFATSFRTLALTLGNNTCMRYAGGRPVGAFSMHHFEAFSLGIVRLHDSLDPDNAAQMNALKAALEAAKNDGELRTLTTGGGRNTPGQYRQKIELVEARARAAL